jgi:plastocyanin
MYPQLRITGMQRRILTFIAISALAVGLAACGSSSKSSTSGAATTASGSAQITIDKNFDFNVTDVKAGSTVSVKNDSTSQHTVTSDDGKAFDVTIDPGKTATFTAPAAGSYKFHCKIHSFMKSTLKVT